RLLIRALMLEHREGNIKSSVVDSLNSKLDTCPDQSDAIWMLLSDLSAVFKVKPQKAILAWNALEDGDPNNRVRYVSKVLAKSCNDININTRVDLICDLKDKIENFKLEARETLLIRMFTTIGEVVQFSPQLMSIGLRHFDALKTVLASDICHEEELPILNSAMPSLNPTPAASRAPSPTHSVDEKIAKATIPVFVKQLRLNPDHVIRNNIALVVCDLCIRCAGSARSIPESMSFWKGQLRESHDYLQIHGKSYHSLFIRLEPRSISYLIQLSTYDDGRKFGLMAQICTQILCPVMNGKLKYDNPRVYALVKDALTVMSLKEIKLNMDVGKGPDEEDEPPAAVVAVAKEIVTIAFRKAMLEYVMPTLLDLRAYFNERRSALRKELYAIFRAICREHKEQMDAFLDGDAQLKAEVEYDIRRYEHREKVERALAKKRAEEAAAIRRMSRRSLAAPRQNNNDREDMNTTQRNTSAEDRALEQGPTVRGDEIPSSNVVRINLSILRLLMCTMI
ncbi:hypothetical protein ANCDUO_23406, partial [Ancylostoma duodenale]